MPRLDFYNVNSGRTYPLVNRNSYTFIGSVVPTNELELTEDILLDTGFMMGILADIDANEPMYLRYIYRDATTLSFVFEIGLSTFIFQRPAASVFGETGFVDALAVEDGNGFLVTGALAALHAAAAAETVWEALDDFQIEPALIQTLKDSYMLDLGLASVPNVPSGPPAECTSSSSASPADPVVTARDMVGDLVFKPGYNCKIEVKTRSNELQISASIGDGYGETCGEIDPDAPSSESAQLDGVTCADIISTLNGVSPSTAGAFTISAGSPGIQITPIASQNKIIIDFSLDDLDGAYCLD